MFQDFPVIFHGVMGIDAREASSPSFFNVAEVEVLMSYVQKLLETQGKSQGTLAPRDIGIITPYRKQVRMNSCDTNMKSCSKIVLLIGEYFTLVLELFVWFLHRCRKSERHWRKLKKTSSLRT